MIKCATCKFSVSNKMRHSLIKNMCPACGAALIGEFHMQRLSLIKEKLSNQEFSTKLNQQDIFDISLFIMSEFFPSSPARVTAKDIEESGLDLSASKAEDIEEIREQVRREVLMSSEDSEIESEEDVEEEYEYGEEPILADQKSELDLKVAKLKRIYNEAPRLNKSGISVRRIT